MDTKCFFILVQILLTSLRESESAAGVSLTQETPCLSAQSCLLKCSVVTGTNDKGLHICSDIVCVVSCPAGRDTCMPTVPERYNHTQVDYSTSYVDIRSFDVSHDARTWSCMDGENGTPSRLSVVQNALPTGPLTYGSTCVSGRATSPASLSCSAPNPGVPPATFFITNSNNASAGNGIGNVAGTVNRGGNASCSVTWPAFPSYPLSISPVLCDVQGAPFPPESLAARPSTGSVELFWAPGFAGGDFFQWFHVQYRRQDSQEGQWSNVSTADNRSSSDRTPVTVTVQGLQPDTSYVFRVRAQSSRPQRNLSNYTEVTWITLPNAPSNGGAVIGGVVGGIMGLVLVVVLVIVVIFKLRLKKKNAQAESSYSDLHLATRETPRDTATYEELQGSQNPNVPQSVHSDSTYTGLDLASRARPRDSAAYGQLQQRQNQSGAAAESASEGHYSDLDPASKVRLPEQSPYQPLAVYQNQQSVASPAQDLTSTAAYTNMP